MIFQDDKTLFAAIRNGDKPSFDQLFLKYYIPLCVYSGQFVGNDEGEEIVQTLMLNLWEKRCNIVLDSSLNAYLFAAVRNKCYTANSTAQRQNRILRVIHEKLRDEIENPDYYDVDRLSREIDAALAKLPDTYRETFMMNRFEEKNYRQIADELDVSVQTVAYRIGQSLKILRKELKDYMPLFIILVS
jgi:RNA polymerase sigma-70 factor (ECF subfamily)